MKRIAFEDRTKAAYFNGTEASGQAKLTLVNDRTESATFNQKITIATLCRTLRRGNGANNTIICQRNGGAMGGFNRYALQNGTNYKPSASITTSPDSSTTSQGYTIGCPFPVVDRWAWHIVVFDPTALRFEMYINKDLVASTTLANTDPIVYQGVPQSMRVGGFDPANGAVGWHGWMKTMMVFERAFNYDEICELVNKNTYDDADMVLDLIFDKLVINNTTTGVRQRDIDRSQRVYSASHPAIYKDIAFLTCPPIPEFVD